jgi:hypothetical protein
MEQDVRRLRIARLILTAVTSIIIAVMESAIQQQINVRHILILVLIFAELLQENVILLKHALGTLQVANLICLKQLVIVVLMDFAMEQMDVSNAILILIAGLMEMLETCFVNLQI